MKIWLPILIACMSIAGLSISSSMQDPMRVDPSIYNIKLNNERVRAFVVVFKPGQSIGVHSHPDHVVYSLTSGRLMIHEVGKDPVTMDVPAGTTLFLPAQSHSAKNVGNTTLKLFSVELK